MLSSYFQPLGKVVLPYASRQLYMGEFDLKNPILPDGYEDYEETVFSLCDAVGAHHGMAYLTVDEKALKMGETQRKPGPHVDGRYIKGVSRRGHDGGGGGWNHSCNVLPARMAVIVASSFPLCRAWEGEFEGLPRLDGSCAHILDREGVLDEAKRLDANQAYLLSPDCIHESLPAVHEIERTFIRIALPLEYHT